MPKVDYDHDNDVYYINENEQEKNERILKEQTKEKYKDKKNTDLTRAEKDDLIILLAKLHGLIE